MFLELLLEDVLPGLVVPGQQLRGDVVLREVFPQPLQQRLALGLHLVHLAHHAPHLTHLLAVQVHCYRQDTIILN